MNHGGRSDDLWVGNGNREGVVDVNGHGREENHEPGVLVVVVAAFVCRRKKFKGLYVLIFDGFCFSNREMKRSSCFSR